MTEYSKIYSEMLKKQEQTATMLHQIAQRIVFDIKVKYNYSYSEIKAYLQGCTDTAEDNQQALEKRDKMLREVIEEHYRTGKWIEEKREVGGDCFLLYQTYIHCSECGKEHYSGTLPKPNFCDNCGADMRGEPE